MELPSELLIEGIAGWEQAVNNLITAGNGRDIKDPKIQDVTVRVDLAKMIAAEIGIEELTFDSFTAAIIQKLMEIEQATADEDRQISINSTAHMIDILRLKAGYPSAID